MTFRYDINLYFSLHANLLRFRGRGEAAACWDYQNNLLRPGAGCSRPLWAEAAPSHESRLNYVSDLLSSL